jgi:hypothetical protein
VLLCAVVGIVPAAVGAAAWAAGEAKVAFQVHGGYFESNRSGLKGDASYLVLTDAKRFDQIFGEAVVMGPRPNFLPADAFASKLVVAVIKRGTAPYEYKVDGVTAEGGVLTVRYSAAAKEGGGTAKFSSPLILSVGKGEYTAVDFVEGGKKVDTVRVSGSDPAPRPQEGGELEPLIDKVLKAHGGEAKLRGLRAFVEKSKTTPAGGPASTVDRYHQLPDRTRLESEFEVAGKRVKCRTVYAGDRGWRKTDDQPTVPLRSPYAGRKEPLEYAGPRAWLRLKDPAATLAPLGETKVGDRAAFGILLKSAGAPEEKLFFDKEGGLLLKAEQAINYPQRGESVREETYYEDYRAADGIPVARKVTRKRDGKTAAVTEVTEFRVADKLDAQLFREP